MGFARTNSSRVSRTQRLGAGRNPAQTARERQGARKRQEAGRALCLPQTAAAFSGFHGFCKEGKNLSQLVPALLFTVLTFS